MGVSKTLERAHLKRAVSNTARVRWPLVRMTTDSGTPTLRARVMKLRRRSWNQRPSSSASDGALEALLMSTRRVFVLGFTKTKPFFFNREGECERFLGSRRQDNESRLVGLPSK